MNLLCRTLKAVHRGEAPLLPAIHSCEVEMLDYGFAAVRTALQSQRQGLRSNRIPPFRWSPVERSYPRSFPLEKAF